MGNKNKLEKEKQLLLTQQKDELLAHTLKFSKKRFKKFEEVVKQLYLNEDLSVFFNDRRVWKVHECFNNFSSKVKLADRKILKDALIYLHNCSCLVSTEEYIPVISNMVQFKAYWLKDLFKWKPLSKQGNAQTKELADYLFCKYSIPQFLYQCLYELKNNYFINWLIHIGNGGKPKEMQGIPIPFTQKMGHYFLQAPIHYSITEVLRWAQVKGLNGNDDLAERIAYSWIGNKTYGDEIFWETFIHLLIKGGMFNHNKIGELIDYVRESKRANIGYSLKGRTLQSLLRQSDAWHGRFALNKQNQTWKSCGIEGFRLEKKTEIIVLEELTESKWLSEEGKAMKHCVGTYAFYCAKGKSAIFSLRKYADGILLEILATIEVNLSLKRIVQAKAKMNKAISYEANKYMEAWAIKENLAINPYL